MDPALVREKYEWSNLWWDCADDDSLPRVLLIGDSISVGYGPTVIGELAALAHVDRLSNSRNLLDPVHRRETRLVLEHGNYAAIHFNNGLHGWHLTDAEYEQGLADYVALLRELAPSAQLVWASSTPVTVVDEPGRLNEQKNAVVRRRNAVAARVVAGAGLAMNDLYSLVVDRAELKSNDGYHFNAEGQRVLGLAVAAVLRQTLSG